MTDQMCAHSACSCQAAEDSDYCSEACRDSAQHQESVCTCGHPNCGH